MRARSSRLLLPLLLSAALGCAGVAPTGSCPESASATLASPALLRAQADVALADGDPELAYRYLALIQTLHPQSADARELFPAAAKLFKRLYFANRIARPDSVWLVSEPVFMFQWLATYFQGSDSFPEAQMATLFVGMPLPFYDDFAAFAKTRPALARWQMQARADDGRVEAVSGRLAESARTGVTAAQR